jgi:hypothetical protein
LQELSDFISFNLFTSETKTKQPPQKKLDKLKHLVPVLILLFIAHYFFSESFNFWRNQIILTNANSYNTIQALFVFLNNSFLGISYFLEAIAFLSIIRIILNLESLTSRMIYDAFIKTQQLSIFSKTFISLIFGIFFFNPFLMFVCLLILFIPSQKKWLSFLQIPLILAFSFLIISPDFYFSKSIFVGLINIKTLFIYYNEYFILSPFNMCYLTFCEFILFSVFVYFIALKKIKWDISLSSILAFLLPFSVFVFRTEIISSYNTILNESRKSKPLENKLARFVSPIIENKGYRQSFTQLEQVKRNLITTHFISNQPATSNELIVCHTNLASKYSKFNLDLPTVNPSEHYTIYQNQWTTVQSLFVPSSKKVKIVSVEITSIAKSFLEDELYVGQYVYCKASSYHPKPAGWVIDPLIPIQKNHNRYSTKISIPYLENRCFFLNLFCRQNGKIGDYPVRYKVTYLNAEGKQKILENRFTLKVRKHKQIPKNKIQQAFSFDPWWVNWYYNDSTMADRKSKEYCAFLQKFNISPTFLYGRPQLWPSINELKQLKNEKFCVGYLNGSKTKNSIHENSIQEIKERVSILKKHQLHRNAYLFVCDEFTPNHWKNIDSIRITLKKEGLDFLPIITTSYGYNFNNQKDFECPILENYLKTTNSYKDSTWTYICNTTIHPNPNFFLEYPLSDISTLFKTLRSNKINGFLYWSLNCWNNNLPQKNTPKMFNPQTWNTFSYKQFNGDGMFIYPGPNGHLYPSIRLMKLRDELVGN